MDPGPITQDPDPAGTLVPDQRGVCPHPPNLTKPTAPEGHNLPTQHEGGANPLELGFQPWKGLEPPFRLGSGAARFRPLARFLAALLCAVHPMHFFVHFLILPEGAFNNRQLLGTYLSILFRRPPWRRALLVCVSIQVYLFGWSSAELHPGLR